MLSRIISSCSMYAKINPLLPSLTCQPSQQPQHPTTLLVFFWMVAEIFKTVCLWRAELGCKPCGLPICRRLGMLFANVSGRLLENWTGMPISHLLPFLTGGDFLCLQIPFPSHTSSQLPSLPQGQGAPYPACKTQIPICQPHSDLPLPPSTSPCLGSQVSMKGLVATLHVLRWYLTSPVTTEVHAHAFNFKHSISLPLAVMQTNCFLSVCHFEALSV